MGPSWGVSVMSSACLLMALWYFDKIHLLSFQPVISLSPFSLSLPFSLTNLFNFRHRTVPQDQWRSGYKEKTISCIVAKTVVPGADNSHRTGAEMRVMVHDRLSKHGLWGLESQPAGTFLSSIRCHRSSGRLCRTWKKTCVWTELFGAIDCSRAVRCTQHYH